MCSNGLCFVLCLFFFPEPCVLLLSSLPRRRQLTPSFLQPCRRHPRQALQAARERDRPTALRRWRRAVRGLVPGAQGLVDSPAPLPLHRAHRHGARTLGRFRLGHGLPLHRRRRARHARDVRLLAGPGCDVPHDGLHRRAHLVRPAPHDPGAHVRSRRRARARQGQARGPPLLVGDRRPPLLWWRLWLRMDRARVDPLDRALYFRHLD